MNRRLLFYSIIGFFFVGILGSLSHFFYDWSGENRLAALFCPVNESTWEHMKLIFFPMLLYTPFIVKMCREDPFVLSAMLLSNLAGTFTVPVLFYTYSGIYGAFVSWIDITIFFLSVLLAFFLTFRVVKMQKKEGADCSCLLCIYPASYEKILILGNVILALAFFFFTFYPPAWGIFQEPL